MMAKTVYVDGMFNRIISRPFVQLFIIHAFVKGDSAEQVPLALLLMSRRRMKDYKAVFNVIKNLIPVHWHSVVTDFEVTVWQAARDVFPDVSVTAATSTGRRLC